MTKAKDDRDDEWREEAERIAQLPPEQQREVVALIGKTADDTAVHWRDRQAARERVQTRLKG